MKKLFIGGVALASIMLSSSSVLAQISPLVVDDFSDVDSNSTFFFNDGFNDYVNIILNGTDVLDGNGNTFPYNPLNPPTNNESNLTGVLGGSRTSVFENAGSNPPAEGTQFYIDPSINTLGIENPPDTTTKLTLTWDGESLGLGSIAPYNKLLLSANFADLDPTVLIEVNANNKTASITRALGIFNETNNFEFLFGDFTGDKSVFGEDNIDSIVMTITGPEGYDLAINLVQLEQLPPTVPEPSLIFGTSVVLATGMLSLKRKSEDQ